MQHLSQTNKNWQNKTFKYQCKFLIMNSVIIQVEYIGLNSEGNLSLPRIRIGK